MRRNVNGNNLFKRAFRDSIECNLTDARNPKNLGVIHEPQKFTFIQDPITGFRYIQILPNRRQKFSDKNQLKTFSGYRLIDTDCLCGGCGVCGQCPC